MLSRIAHVLVPVFGRLSVTTDPGADLAPGSIIAANHTSLADPAIVIAALHRLGVEPVIMATMRPLARSPPRPVPRPRGPRPHTPR